MRIRSTRPHFWRSERIASVSWDARLVLKGLESYVDDNGVGKDDIALIVGDLFQRDMIREPSRTVARVSEAISELAAAGLLWRYTVEGTRLLYIAFWEEVQRIDKAQDGRHPRPDGTLNYKDSAIRESSATPREGSRTFAPVVEEEGSRGVGEQERTSSDPDGSDHPKSDYPSAFEDWWVRYPRKDAKRKALEAWRRARKRATDQELIDGADRYFLDPNRQEQFTKQPATWLNGDCWLSDALPNPPVLRAVGSPVDDKVNGWLALANTPGRELE